MADERVQVGASYNDPILVLPGLLAVAGGIGASVFQWAAHDPVAATGVLVPSAALAVVAVGRFWRVAGDRRWLEATPNGVLLTDRHGTVELADAAVIDLATDHSVIYSNGLPSQRRRDGSLVVAVADGDRVVRVGYTYPLAGPDPLGDWFERVGRSLGARAEAALAAGGNLVGDDWVLHPDRLEWASSELPLSEVAAVGIADGKVCVWAVGVAEPAVRIPAGSANARVLVQVLDARLAERSAPPPEPTDGLGRLVFERDRSMGWWKVVGGWLLVAVLTLVVGGGVVGAVTDPNQKDLLPLAIGASLFGLVTLAVAAHLIVNRVNHLKLYERGVTLRRRNRTYTLRWADCGSYTHSATRRYVKGSYVGTEVKLRFDPAPGAAGDTVTYSATVKNADDELDRLRGWVGHAVADRLATLVAAGERVPWLPGAAFTAAGMEVRRAGLFGRKSAEVVPYDRTGTYAIKDGQFRLTLAGEQKPALRGSTAAPNFFPGLELLHRLASQLPAG